MKEVRDSERILSRQFSAEPQPGHDATPLETQLEDAGVHPDAIPAVVRIVEGWAVVFAAESFRRRILSLGKSPAAKILERVFLGTGASLAEDAAEVGTSKQALHVSETRLRAQLAKSTG